MSISNDLIKQFVQITKDSSPVKHEATVYGTAVEYEGKMYVQIDGSELLTPVETATEISNGERVTVMIKDHNATVTGNLSNPSAGSNTVANIKGDLNDIGTQITEFEVVIADKVSTKDFEANNAAINNLIAGKAEINELNAVKANIESLQAEDAKINNLVAEKADITELNATNAKITKLQSDKADISELNAVTGNINDLTADIAKISTLIGGDASIDNVQTILLTSANTSIDNALIKNAMIESVSAEKVNTGTLNTNKVNIQSEDGGIVLAGSTQQFKDQNGNVRVQIGKDAQGNFTFCLFSQDGVGILLDETGIKAGAVPNGLIVNDMVADNANISGGKLDISSVVTAINGNTTTINSSIIKFDDTGQSLTVAFNTLKDSVASIEEVVIDGNLAGVMEQVRSNTTSIEAMQGNISTLISNTTITKENGQVVQLKDDYSTTKQTVNEISNKIGTLETNYKKTLKSSSVQYYLSTSLTSLSGGNWQDTAPEWTQGKYMWQRMKYTYTDDSVTYGTASCVAGAKGDTGEQGPQGPQGEQGAQGIQGLQGPQGEQGIQGVKGDTGAQGPQGPQGDKGNTGEQGPKGDKGDKGDTGPQGVQGPAGNDGKTYYTWIKYADSSTGSGMSNDPTGKTYIGFAYNKATPTESNTASDYTWSLIKGDKGDTGVQGPAGQNGVTTYTWIKYSDNADGTGLYDTPKSTTKYIGIATNKTTATESTTKTDYTWSLFKGDTGAQGPQGPAGKTTYFHIKYSANSNGNPMSETPNTYIGTYVDYTPDDSTDYTKYTWSRFQGLQGEKGEQGIPGNNGDDGQTYYLHIKYSNDGGQTLTDNNGETPGNYIGVYTDTNKADSTVVSKYTWSKIKGEQGPQGSKGDKGDKGDTGISISKITNYYLATNLSSGVTSTTTGWTTTIQNVSSDKKYLWNYEKVEYSSGNPTVTTPCIIGAYGDTGPQGGKGDTGATGKGISLITEYYQVSNSNTTVPTSWSTTVPKLTTTNRYLWNYENIKYTDNSSVDTTKKVIGVYGDTGPQGSKGDTGSQGPKGDKGATGEKGQSLTSSTPQWYLSTSNTTQTGGSWQDTMPQVTTGKYIWQRFKNVWANPTATTYTTPVLEQIEEAVKEVISKQAEFQESLDGFKTTVSQTYTTKTEFNNLTIGGRNLLKDSKNLTKAVGIISGKWIVEDTGSEGFKKLAIDTTETSWVECHIPLYAPINTLTKNLTISFEYYEGTTGLLVFNLGVFKSDGARIKELTNWVVSSSFKLLDKPDWKRVSLTFDPSSVNNQTDATEYRIQFKKASDKTGKCYVRKFKLEIGDKATDWSPAPEDISETYATNENLINSEESINNNIASSVETAKGEILDNVANNYVDNATYQEFTNSVSSSLEQTASDIEMKFTTVSEGITNVEGSLEEYKNVVSTNIRFSDDGMEIGKTDSPFGVSISNEKMSFTENETEVAYISNQEMLITDANIQNSLRIGYFKFVPRNNGNLSLVWDEGNNLLKSGSSWHTYATQTLTATKDDCYWYTDITAYLTAGVNYKFTCETDGTWGENSGTDTVQCYLSDKKDGTQAGTTHIHLARNSYTFTVPTTGTWYLRFDVNKNGTTHSFWNMRIERV